jgi:hypothetical protein
MPTKAVGVIDPLRPAPEPATPLTRQPALATLLPGQGSSGPPPPSALLHQGCGELDPGERHKTDQDRGSNGQAGLPPQPLPLFCQGRFPPTKASFGLPLARRLFVQARAQRGPLPALAEIRKRVYKPLGSGLWSGAP